MGNKDSRDSKIKTSKPNTNKQKDASQYMRNTFNTLMELIKRNKGSRGPKIKISKSEDTTNHNNNKQYASTAKDKNYLEVTNYNRSLSEDSNASNDSGISSNYHEHLVNINDDYNTNLNRESLAKDISNFKRDYLEINGIPKDVFKLLEKYQKDIMVTLNLKGIYILYDKNSSIGDAINASTFTNDELKKIQEQSQSFKEFFITERGAGKPLLYYVNDTLDKIDSLLKSYDIDTRNEYGLALLRDEKDNSKYNKTLKDLYKEKIILNKFKLVIDKEYEENWAKELYNSIIDDDPYTLETIISLLSNNADTQKVNDKNEDPISYIKVDNYKQENNPKLPDFSSSYVGNNSVATVTNDKIPLRDRIKLGYEPIFEDFGKEALHNAAVSGDMNHLVRILKSGVDINEKNSKGDTALQHLLRHLCLNQYSIDETLLKKYKDIANFLVKYSTVTNVDWLDDKTTINLVNQLDKIINHNESFRNALEVEQNTTMEELLLNDSVKYIESADNLIKEIKSCVRSKTSNSPIESECSINGCVLSSESSGDAKLKVSEAFEQISNSGFKDVSFIKINYGSSVGYIKKSSGIKTYVVTKGTCRLTLALGKEEIKIDISANGKVKVVDEKTIQKIKTGKIDVNRIKIGYTPLDKAVEIGSWIGPIEHPPFMNEIKKEDIKESITSSPIIPVNPILEQANVKKKRVQTDTSNIHEAAQQQDFRTQTYNDNLQPKVSVNEMEVQTDTSDVNATQQQDSQTQPDDADLQPKVLGSLGDIKGDDTFEWDDELYNYSYQQNYSQPNESQPNEEESDLGLDDTPIEWDDDKFNDYSYQSNEEDSDLELDDDKYKFKKNDYSLYYDDERNGSDKLKWDYELGNESELSKISEKKTILSNIDYNTQELSETIEKSPEKSQKLSENEIDIRSDGEIDIPRKNEYSTRGGYFSDSNISSDRDASKRGAPKGIDYYLEKNSSRINEDLEELLNMVKEAKGLVHNGELFKGKCEDLSIDIEDFVSNNEKGEKYYKLDYKMLGKLRNNIKDLKEPLQKIQSEELYDKIQDKLKNINKSNEIEDIKSNYDEPAIESMSDLGYGGDISSLTSIDKSFIYQNNDDQSNSNRDRHYSNTSTSSADPGISVGGSEFSLAEEAQSNTSAENSKNSDTNSNIKEIKSYINNLNKLTLDKKKLLFFGLVKEIEKDIRSLETLITAQAPKFVQNKEDDSRKKHYKNIKGTMKDFLEKYKVSDKKSKISEEEINAVFQEGLPDLFCKLTENINIDNTKYAFLIKNVNEWIDDLKKYKNEEQGLSSNKEKKKKNTKEDIKERKNTPLTAITLPKVTQCIKKRDQGKNSQKGK